MATPVRTPIPKVRTRVFLSSGAAVKFLRMALLSIDPLFAGGYCFRICTDR